MYYPYNYMNLPVRSYFKAAPLDKARLHTKNVQKHEWGS